MNQKEFKNALLCGQGRCYLACRKQPERYRSSVLWGCTHQLAYDPQCEGTRAWLLYRLVSCYPDRTPFRDASITVLSQKSAQGWLLLQAEEFLNLLANDGDTIAKEAVWQKYGELLAALHARKRRVRSHADHSLDDYVFLAIMLCADESDALRIAADIGLLVHENRIYQADDFEQVFLQFKICRHLTALRRLAKTNEHAARFLRMSEASEKAADETSAGRLLSNEQQKSISSYQFSRDADDEAFRLYAEMYIAEREPENRANLLRAFAWNRSFPLDPDPIITDALSENARLRSTAWDALHLIRHPKVRAFALTQTEAKPEERIPVLIANGTENDRPLLEQLLAQIPSNRQGADRIHAIGSCVLDLHTVGIRVPEWILRYLYDHGRCSECRASIVDEMGRRRILSVDILNECLYDANGDIRTYAKKRLAHRQP